MIKKIFIGLAIFSLSIISYAQESYTDEIKVGVKNFWEKSNWEGIVSIGSYHDRNYYSSKSINRFNERNEGYGVGLVYTSGKGNEHSVKYLRISDSEYNPQHLFGYQYMYNIFKSDIDLQLGVMTGITSRKMIKDNKRITSPFILPAFGVKAWNVKVNLTYIPELKLSGDKYGGLVYSWMTYEFK